MNRTSGMDVTNAYAWTSDADDPSTELAAGGRYRIAFFSDSARSTPLKVHSVDRWERFVDVEGVRGLKGEKGETGAKGDEGEQGIQGIQGIQGAKGEKGETGPAGSGLPTEGTDFPQTPSTGDRFLLLSADDVPQDKALDSVQRQATLRAIYLGGGVAHPRYIYAYSPTYAGTGAALLRNKVFAVYGGARTKTANTLYLHRTRLTRSSYAIVSGNVAGFPYWHEVTGLNYDSLLPGSYFVNVGNTDGTLMFPDEPYAIGDYSWDGNDWILTPGIAAPWAAQGQPEPRTLTAVTQLIDGPGAGLIITDSSNTARGALTGFMPAFDLDDTGNEHGLIPVEATIRLSGRSSNTIGFDDNVSDPQLSIIINGFTFANRLRGKAAYAGSAATRTNGEVIGFADVRNGSGTLGRVTLWFGHDANNVVGHWLEYVGASGSLGFTFFTDIQAAFVHNDGPSSDGYRHVLITAADYAALTIKDPNTLYLVP